jgi:arylformamidase
MASIYLSHFLDEETPLYGGEKAIFIENSSEISKGASSNTKLLRLPNHSGTHIDFPNHFSDNGKNSCDYDADFWTFNHVVLINYPAQKEEIIDNKMLKTFEKNDHIEFLIINTDFQKYRHQKEYWNNNPGLSPELAKTIRNLFPKIKAVGFDFISVSSYQNRELGRLAHKEFLVNHDILLIEDMKLDQLEEKKIKSVIALPWLINQIDGVPISIIAEYE